MYQNSTNIGCSLSMLKQYKSREPLDGVFGIIKKFDGLLVKD
jgi:hypothetical protein